MNDARKTALTIAVLMAIGLLALIIEWLLEVAGRRWLALIGVGIVALVLLLGIHFAGAHDSGQWDDTDLVTRHWYQTLMQPDSPTVSCCGEADAYWCDILKTEAVDGRVKNYCIITDDREDAPRQRPHIDIGTEIEIPDHKMKWDRSNPTGHNIVFLSRAGYVFCFVQSSGV